MTCCDVGNHAQIAAIDSAIRAQQAASRANNATSAPSYTAIARAYSVPKPALLRHRDECLARKATVDGGRGTDRHSVSGVPAVAQRVPAMGRTVAEPAQNDGASSAVDVCQTGPHHGMGHGGPGDERSGAEDVGGGARDAGAESRGEGVGHRRPPERSRPADLRARARENGRRGWEKVANDAAEQAVRAATHAVVDSEIADPNSTRAHATYVQEIIELVDCMEWNNARSVDALTRKWNKPKMYVLGCYRDACTLMRLARGSPNEDREVSLRLWHNLFMTAMAKGDPISLKVAAEARKGYDAASGIVDKSAKVQINIAQDPQAQEFVRRILVTLQQFPDALAAVRQDVAQVAAADPTAILTTGAEVDAAE